MFKAGFAMEAISGRKTLQEIAADHAVHPIQVSQWRSLALGQRWNDLGGEVPHSWSTTEIDQALR